MNIEPIKESELETGKPIEGIKSKLDSNLQRVLLLKDYAVANNFDVPDSVISDLAVAQTRLQGVDLRPTEQTKLTIDVLSNLSVLIDRSVRDLTKLTYPTTIDTLLVSEGTTEIGAGWFKTILVVVSLFGIVAAVESFYQIQPLKLWPSILAASTGLLGAIVYILFNVIGVISEKAFNLEDKYSNIVRLILGPIIGWVFYFSFAQNSFNGENSQQQMLLLLPFLAGFSTRFVVGLINQALRAVELTLGIEDKGSQLLGRRNRKKDDTLR
ncbi:MAG: hypothetical protein ABR936_14660 [Bacteroidota bacterium]|jgi:hypothetical protein